MMKLIFNILLFTIVWFGVYGQSLDNTNFVTLQILNDSLHFSSKDADSEISIRFKNRSDKDILTYGLDFVLRSVPLKADKLCDQNEVSAGLGLIVYGNKESQIFAGFSIRDNKRDKPMTKERLDSIRQNGKNQLRRDTVILKKRSDKVFAKCINLRDFCLKSGTYFVQVIYYCGRQIVYNISKEDIGSDIKKFKAELYQGCSYSNRIKVIID